MPRAAQFAKNLQHFRLVTFDVTDTLLRFRRAPAIQYAKTAAQLGVTDIDQKRLEQCFRQEFKLMAKEHPNFGCHTPDMSWQQWWLQLVQNIFRCVKPAMPTEQTSLLAETLLHVFRTSECWTRIAYGEELVQRMRSAGKCVGVISNFDPSLRTVLRVMELEDKFDFVLTSYDAGVQKPNNKIFKKALDLAQVLPQQALHIGNLYEVDYLGARAAGWSSLLLVKDAAEVKRVQPTHLHASIKDMIHALETSDVIW